VADIRDFVCDVPEDDGTCRQPYMPSYEFKQLGLDNIYRLLEVNQVGINSTSKLPFASFINANYHSYSWYDCE
jgi:hypothetical protein